MTHAELVKRAIRWLRNSRRCRVVLAETGCQLVANWPDAIGWTARAHSILVECKASISDFYSDRSKPSRRVPEALGLGSERWYMAEVGLLTGKALPIGWGLLEVHPSMVRKKIIVPPIPLDPARARREMQMLVARLRVGQEYDWRHAPKEFPKGVSG